MVLCRLRRNVCSNNRRRDWLNTKALMQEKGIATATLFPEPVQGIRILAPGLPPKPDDVMLGYVVLPPEAGLYHDWQECHSHGCGRRCCGRPQLLTGLFAGPRQPFYEPVQVPVWGRPAATGYVAPNANGYKAAAAMGYATPALDANEFPETVKPHNPYAVGVAV